MPQKISFDITIIGAGPAGMAFACMLADSGLRIAILEKQTLEQIASPEADGRDIAMTHQSLEILTRLGIWQRFGNATISPIREARVVDGDSPYSLNFDTNSDKDEALGFLVANHHIRKAVYEQTIAHEHIELLTDTEVINVHTDDRQGHVQLADGNTISSNLVIAADTRFSSTRRMMGIPADMLDFGRSAIVCEMEHERPHNNVAFECFHYGRTLAILPMPGNVSSAVITVPNQIAQQVSGMDEAAFNADIENRLQHQLGKMKLVTQRYTYPLVAVHAKRFNSQRFALIGDAAVGMHPVTAHGYNLGLSGAEILSGEIINAIRQQKDIGSDAVLRAYNFKHQQTTLPMFHGTNSVVSLFTNDNFPATLVRKAVLRLSNNLPPVKWAIKRKLMEKHPLRVLPRPPALGKLPGLKTFLG
jgi:ubiquinone biosynthesis UbiH/UbiF/VisC/COQ6 family hydroxylase